MKTAKSKKKIKRARQTPEYDGRELIREFIMETLSRFIASDDFKVMVAERFLLYPDPTIHFICRYRYMVFVFVNAYINPRSTAKGHTSYRRNVVTS